MTGHEWRLTGGRVSMAPERNETYYDVRCDRCGTDARVGDSKMVEVPVDGPARRTYEIVDMLGQDGRSLFTGRAGFDCDERMIRNVLGS